MFFAPSYRLHMIWSAWHFVAMIGMVVIAMEMVVIAMEMDFAIVDIDIIM